MDAAWTPGLASSSPRPAWAYRRASRRRPPPTAAQLLASQLLASPLLAAQLDLVPRTLPGSKPGSGPGSNVPSRSSLNRRALRGRGSVGMVRCGGSASVEIGARSCSLALPSPAAAAAAAAATAAAATTAAAAAAASLPVAVRAGGRGRAGWLAECGSHGEGQHGHLCEEARPVRQASSRSTPANWPRPRLAEADGWPRLTAGRG